MAVELDYYADKSGRQSRLAPWALGLAGGALVLVILDVVFVGCFAYLALPMGLAALVLGFMVMKDRRRLGMASVSVGIGVVTVILSGLLILAGSLGGRLTGRVAAARRNATIRCIEQLSIAVDACKADVGRYPTNSEGLDALLLAPAGLEVKWKGPYIAGGKLPLDGWGHDFYYRFPGKLKPADFEIVSAGADGVPGTGDDIDRRTKP